MFINIDVIFLDEKLHDVFPLQNASYLTASVLTMGLYNISDLYPKKKCTINCTGRYGKTPAVSIPVIN